MVSDHELTPYRRETLALLRVGAAFVGVTFLTVGFWMRTTLDLIRRAAGWTRLPVGTVRFVAAVWVGLVAVNLALIAAGVETGSPKYFPISVFRGPTVHWDGMVYAFAFLALLTTVIKSPPKGVTAAWLAGSAFLLLGNLEQGGTDAAFYDPFLTSTIQYLGASGVCWVLGVLSRANVQEQPQR